MKATKIVLLALSVGLLATTAASAEPPTAIDLRSIDSSLAKLPLGKGTRAAMQWVRARVTRHYSAQLRAARTVEERRRINWRFMRDVRDIQKSMVVFDGRHDKRLEQTVIAGEFQSKSGESMLKFLEGGAEHYLFFFEGKLWKYARTMKTEGREFNERVAELMGALGIPPRATYSTDGSSAENYEASWFSFDLELRLTKRPERFGVDLLILESPRLARDVVRKRAERSQRHDGYTSSLLPGA